MDGNCLPFVSREEFDEHCVSICGLQVSWSPRCEVAVTILSPETLQNAGIYTCIQVTAAQFDGESLNALSVVQGGCNLCWVLVVGAGLLHLQ